MTHRIDSSLLDSAVAWRPILCSLILGVLGVGVSACSGTPPATCSSGGVGGGTGIDPCSTGGATSAGGATSTGGTMGTGGSAIACPAAPSGVSTDVTNAYNLENNTRTAMGVPCASMVTALNTSALNHCQYYVQNVASGATSLTGTQCASQSTAHDEVSGCPLFTGADPGAREKAAGYTGTSWSEDMAFDNNGTQAVQSWIDSVWHRTPILSPWVRDFGYGNAGSGTGSSAVKCDTMDFSTGTTTAATVVATYPYAGQTGVPTSFNGSYEGPTPPAPPSGWPSGYPIHIYAKKATISDTRAPSWKLYGHHARSPMDYAWQCRRSQ